MPLSTLFNIAYYSRAVRDLQDSLRWVKGARQLAIGSATIAAFLLVTSSYSAANDEGVVIDEEWLAHHPAYRARVSVQERFAGELVGEKIKIFTFSFSYIYGIDKPAYCSVASVTVYDDCAGELRGVSIGIPDVLTNEDKRELSCKIENYDDENVRLTATERPGSRYESTHHVLIPKVNRTVFQPAVGYSGHRTFYIDDRVLSSSYEPIQLERDHVDLTRFKLECDQLLLPTITGGRKP